MTHSLLLRTAPPRRARLPIVALLSVGGIALDRCLEHSPAAPWFAPVYYLKLLIGHAAVSVWSRKP